MPSDYLYPKRKLEKVAYLKKNAVPSVFGNETFDQINISEKLDTKLILEVSRYFGQEKPELLPPYHIPEAVNKMPAEDHRLCLVKYVANSYINLRLSSYAKIHSNAVINCGKPSSRHHLTKTILFLNQ